ncbi:MAG: hypothetical protein M1829_000364 [Trizodia sp. TS-e1964]|nr:MAG: hypothetical protein M1829_000364 [Trizodia sp. TS-e1964]
MMIWRLLWELAGALFLASLSETSATPDINVALKASFDSPPFLLELLETAAEENNTCYFPLLDRIAEGHFDNASTDQELYLLFLETLKNDGHINDAESLSTFQLAVSIHSAAPRIAAHYHYYNNSAEPVIRTSQHSSCNIWYKFHGKIHCSPDLGDSMLKVSGSLRDGPELAFDRTYGNATNSTVVLYADVSSPGFLHFHRKLVLLANNGTASYRLRYKPPISFPQSQLMISGYGVELALKRTDYIVIDDRDTDADKPKKHEHSNTSESSLVEEEMTDIRPLSSKELLDLSMKAASFVMASGNPFNTLIMLSQDFPKYTSAIVAHNLSLEFNPDLSVEFRDKHENDRQVLLPRGLNAIWINGVQQDPRKIDAFALLEHIRRERKDPSTTRTNLVVKWDSSHGAIIGGDSNDAIINIVSSIDPASEIAQRWIPILKILSELSGVSTRIFLNPQATLRELPVKRFYRHVLQSKPSFDQNGSLEVTRARFAGIPEEILLTVGMDLPPSWLVAPKECIYDLDNIKISTIKERLGEGDIEALYELEYILIEGHSREVGFTNDGAPPRGAKLVIGTEKTPFYADTIVMSNLGYFQFKANPGYWKMRLQEGRSQEIFNIDSAGTKGYRPQVGDESTHIMLMSFQGTTLFPRLSRKPGYEVADVLQTATLPKEHSRMDILSRGFDFAQKLLSRNAIQGKAREHADINIFSVASGHLYERMLNIMMVSVMRHTKHSVKFWFIEQFLSPSFKDFIPILAAEYNFQYEMVTYKWPYWLRAQKEKQREIWGYKILFLDVLFPLSLDKVIFVDADQIVRTDMYELVTHDLEGAPYGFTPMCDSRTEMEGFRFWKQGYWKTFLRGKPYHISALYVVDLQLFRQMAAGDRLRGQYHQLSADANSLANLDQDLPNHMQNGGLTIHSLPQEWLWCETWCSDESLATARTIDLCNNPLTKEPKLDRARRQVPEWTVYDDEIAALAKRRKDLEREKNGKEVESETRDEL